MNESTPIDAALPLAAAPEWPAARRTYPFEFKGSGREYFRIWIVNLLLTIVTLGIYSAWAKVRRLRYFHGNTVLDGSSFDYHGNPVAILKGRLIVFGVYVAFVVAVQFYQPLVFVMIPALILLVPWIVMRSRKFQLRMTSWRNLRFNFHGTYGGAMAAFIGRYLLTVITLGILYPMWVKKRVEYSLNNSTYGKENFVFEARSGTFFKFCYIAGVLSVVGYVVFIVAFINLPGLQRELPVGVEPTMLDLLVWMGPLGWLLLFIGALVGFAIWGYYQSQFLNASFGNTRVGLQHLRSNLKASSLMWIQMTNLIGIVCTLGIYYPWAKVRQVKYQLENMGVDSDGRLNEFTASAQAQTDALGEEAGDFFDMDLGI